MRTLGEKLGGRRSLANVLQGDGVLSEVPAVRLPRLPLEGGCQCGRLRYQVTATPLTYYFCHCARCRRQSGSAFGSSMLVAAEALELTGERHHLEWRGGSGRLMDHTFCPHCSARIHNTTRREAITALKPGTLDDQSFLHPAGEIFTAQRLPVTPLPTDGRLLYEGAPDFAALEARWSLMLAGGRAT